MYILGKTLKIYIKTEFFCTWQKKKKDITRSYHGFSKKKKHARFALFLFGEDKFKGEIHSLEHPSGFLQMLGTASPD